MHLERKAIPQNVYLARNACSYFQIFSKSLRRFVVLGFGWLYICPDGAQLLVNPGRNRPELITTCTKKMLASRFGMGVEIIDPTQDSG